MRLRTFLATYFLFLFVLYTSFSAVSVYMSNSQVSILKEKSVSEYQTLAASLARDISVLSGKSPDLPEAVERLVSEYIKYYSNHNVIIFLTDLSEEEAKDSGPEERILITREKEEYQIQITGILPGTFHNYQLHYRYDITNHIRELKNVQKVLLFICIGFSLVTAVVLYAILISIFKPLNTVTSATRKIADGQYDERIMLTGKHELAELAKDFNRMAEKIERQIGLLEEEALEKQRFVDNFAHEIRTPLTSVSGYAQYIQKAFLDEKEVIDSAQLIMDEADHMKNIAETLLKLATLKHCELQKTTVKIEELFERIRQSMLAAAGESSVSIAYSSAAEELEGQEDLIKILLMNLCMNSLKACDGKEGSIRMHSWKEGRKIILSVTDNGYGISPESIDKVTEPFYRADKSRSRKEGGAGLGLALCRQIAELHHAELLIESEPGSGTTVKIVFTT